jgi:hypothetical protein
MPSPLMEIQEKTSFGTSLQGNQIYPPRIKKGKSLHLIFQFFRYFKKKKKKFQINFPQ